MISIERPDRTYDCKLSRSSLWCNDANIWTEKTLVHLQLNQNRCIIIKHSDTEHHMKIYMNITGTKKVSFKQSLSVRFRRLFFFAGHPLPWSDIVFVSRSRLY